MRKLPSSLRVLLIFLISAGAGYFAGALIGKVSPRPEAPLRESFSPWLLAVLPFLLFLVILVHEYGHVLGGKLGGLRFLFLTAGPLRVERGSTGLRVQWNRNLALWGGMAAAVSPAELPPEPESLPRKVAPMVAGGPAASLLLALSLWPGLVFLPHHPNVAGALLFTGLTSLAIGLVTLVPHKTLGLPSDGARLLLLLRGGPAAKLWSALMALSTLGSSQRPRNWPAVLVRMLEGPEGSSTDLFMASWLRHSWHLDREEFPEAQRTLDEMFARLGETGEPLRSLAHFSAAFHYARLNNPAPAREHYNRIGSAAFFQPGDLLAAEAAVLASEGRAGAAKEKLAAAEAALADRPQESAAMFREMLKEIRQRIPCGYPPDSAA